jgi:hypothetical protein
MGMARLLPSSHRFERSSPVCTVVEAAPERRSYVLSRINAGVLADQ